MDVYDNLFHMLYLPIRVDQDRILDNDAYDKCIFDKHICYDVEMSLELKSFVTKIINKFDGKFK
jgi:hypothetical protein